LEAVFVEFVIVLNQVMILFIILIIGFASGKFKILDSTATRKLSELLLNVCSPMLVFNSFLIEFSSERLINILWIVGAGGGMFLISILLANLIYKGFDETIKPVIISTAIFSNCGYMGLPLMKALFGEEGVFYGSFYIVLFNIALWSYGFILFGGKGTKAQIFRKVLVKPALIAVYVGMIIFISGIPVPTVIRDATKYVGDMTMPLSMLIIGGVISTVKLNTVFNDWRVYLSSSVRLIIMPLIAIFFARLIGAPELPAAVVATALAMPAAASTTMFSEMFDKNAVFSSKCVTVSTLLSIATIPLLVYFAIK
jgi:predicted permease